MRETYGHLSTDAEGGSQLAGTYAFAGSPSKEHEPQVLSTFLKSSQSLLVFVAQVRDILRAATPRLVKLRRAPFRSLVESCCD